ncbi:RNA polymerase sporulation-specific sigma factor [Selenomonas ruminantium]|uniref:RNA polymerase sporulation-specific sigma factor n=1 Tax=Selenomonas ruminantium TaxID=971 RepID=A0A1M6TRZ0_SELRU|nr:sigma-70 family RNA polymerase sigma factor [Selenomonas ruminantium]SHK59741.1 RNA polymerase sporulation-specific sigma factor [Selenomonas ruminantium]
MRFEQYVEELQRVRPLSRDQEAELWRAYKECGDEDARRQIIESYQPLVFKQALPFRSLQNVMDVVQEGTVGLIEAVERYDPARGVAFSLFAVHRIRGRMLDFLQREGRSDSPCMDVWLEDGGVSLKENLMDASPTVAEQAETHELVGRLRTAMARLPVKEKAVLENVFLGSRDVAAVAEDMELSPGHVYRLQKNGIRRIRGMLAKFMQNW